MHTEHSISSTSIHSIMSSYIKFIFITFKKPLIWAGKRTIIFTLSFPFSHSTPNPSICSPLHIWKPNQNFAKRNTFPFSFQPPTVQEHFFPHHIYVALNSRWWPSPLQPIFLFSWHPFPTLHNHSSLTLIGAMVDALTICSGVASTAPAGTAAAARREERVEREDEEEDDETPPIPDIRTVNTWKGIWNSLIHRLIVCDTVTTTELNWNRFSKMDSD